MCTMYKFWNIFSDKNCYNVFMNTELWQRHPKCSQTSWVDTSSTLKDHYFRLEDLHIIVDNTGSKVTDETTMVFLLFKKILKIVICLPMKHLKFLWTRLNVSVRSRSNLNLEVLVLRRGDNWSTWKKTSWSKGENQQQTQPTYGFDARIWTWATLVGGSLVYIMLIGKLRHQHAIGATGCCYQYREGGRGGHLLSLDLAFISPEELCRSWRVLWAFVPQWPLCPKRLK